MKDSSVIVTYERLKVSRESDEILSRARALSALSAGKWRRRDRLAAHVPPSVRIVMPNNSRDDDRD